MLEMKQTYKLKFEKEFKSDEEIFTFLQGLYVHGGEVASEVYGFITDTNDLYDKYQVFSKEYEKNKKDVENEKNPAN